MENDGLPFKNCTKRSIIYQTWCKTCQRKEERKSDVFKEDEIGISDLFDGNVEPERRKRKMMDSDRVKVDNFIYIGETSRSSYERGGEHYKDLEHKRHKSHMLKHAVNHHPGMNPDHIKFEMKILSSHKTAFERQIREAVLIEKFAGPKLMNSKLEYNRCSIPRITIKMGNKEVEDTEAKKEKEVIEIIKEMYQNGKKRSIKSKNVLEEKPTNNREKGIGHPPSHTTASQSCVAMPPGENIIDSSRANHRLDLPST